MEAVATGARVILTRLEMSDAAFILRLMTDPVWLKYIGDRGVHNSRTARRFLKLQQDDQLLDIPCMLAVRVDGQAVGVCSFLQRDFMQIPDVGYALMPQARGRGLASESLTCLMDLCQTQGVGKRLAALVNPQNLASIRLLTKVGFKSTGMVTSELTTSQVFCYTY